MYEKETWVNAKAIRSQGMSYNEIARALGINKLITIPGVGPLSSAVIESEIKNISRFVTAKKLNGYIGAYPELRESGEFKLPKPRMTKTGNRYLNHAVYMCVLAAISPKAPDSPVKHLYWRQVAQGKEDGGHRLMHEEDEPRHLRGTDERKALRSGLRVPRRQLRGSLRGPRDRLRGAGGDGGFLRNRDSDPMEKGRCPKA